MNGKYKNINLSNSQIKYLYEELKKYLYSNYNGNDIIIHTGNVNIEMSNLDSQRNSNDLSVIDLRDCETILKNKYCRTDNDSLAILKIDIKPEDETSKYIQYEIYEPITKLFLELQECTGINAIINVPVNLNPEIESLYDNLAKSGYNLFDSKDSFYNDICAVFTTENNTDILLYDRRMDIYQLTVNVSLCQEGCKFISYNSETNNAECDCPIKDEKMKTDSSQLKFDKNEMVDEFYETLNNSNFRVLTCYKLVFNIKVFIKNVGSIVMTIIFFLFFILMIVYIFVSSKKLHKYIKSIIKTKMSNGGNKSKEKNNKSNNNKKRNKMKRASCLFKNKRLKLDDSKVEQEQIPISAPPKRNCKEKNLNSQRMSISTNSRNHLNYNSNKNNNNYLSSNDFSLNNNDNEINIYKRKKKYRKSEIKRDKEKGHNLIFNKKRTNKISSEKDVIKVSDSTHEKGEKAKNKIDGSKCKEVKNKKDKKDKKDKKELNDQQMNSLEYKDAIKYDKRTYCQYYISLLKKKHLILFTFITKNDYNLLSMKLSLFLVSISLYFSVNTFFFNDETMHKIYVEGGVYNVIYRIPQILYSSILSSLINLILKTLSLSEKDLLKIKDEKDLKTSLANSKNIKKCLKIKMSVFFIISSLLMLFFWYFISCFCAVYNNTQIILIKDTLISLGLSMLYPFGLNLLPGIFRIPSLRAEKKDKKCLYGFSKIVALI